MTRRQGVLLALAVAGGVLVVGRAIATLQVEYAWYQALALPRLARAHLAGAVLLRGGTTALAALFLFANLYAVRRSVLSFVLPRQLGDLEFGEEVPGRYLVGAAAVIAILTGSFLGIDGSEWPRFALAIEGLRFGERDPYFENDLGFYVGWLPAELLTFAWAQRLLVVTVGLVLVLYALTPSIRWRNRALYVSEYVRRHLTVLGGVLLVVFAWAFRLESYQLLFDGSGPGGAFAAVDLQVRIPGALILAATSLAAGVLVIGAGLGGQVRLAFFAVSVMLLLSVVVRFVLPVALRPGGDRTSIEAPYLATRDGFTRRAFGADRVRTPDGDSNGAPAPPARELIAVTGVAMWDAPALRRAMDGAAAVGWMRRGDEVHALVAQRGFLAEDDPTPWTVGRLAAWTSDAAGAPVALRPPPGEYPDVLAPVVDVDSAPAYRVVSDPAAMVAGTPAEAWGARLAHAWALQNFRLLGRLPPSPTIVLAPQVRERVAAVTPFFAQGDHPRPSVAGDTLYWIVELHTTAETYPLSEPLIFAGRERRYFHPAGHAVVNAATGVVRVVPVPDPEPLARAWFRRYPELIADAGAIPEAVAASLLPSAEALRARALTFARLGATARTAPPERRHLALEDGADSVVAGDVTPLALGGAPGLSLVSAVLDARDRLVGIVIASGPGADTRWVPLPPDRPRPAWGDVLDALRAVDSTSARRDARPVRGAVRIAPTSGGLVFAQPVYLWPPRGRPAIASVNTVSDRGGWTGPVLRLGGGGAAPDTGAAVALPDARDVYRRLRDAMRRGDWTTFGRLLDTLGASLDVPRR